MESGLSRHGKCEIGEENEVEFSRMFLEEEAPDGTVTVTGTLLRRGRRRVPQRAVEVESSGGEDSR